MADYQSQLPVRSQADVDERVQVKIVDSTTVSQQMIVDTDSNAHVEVHGNDPAGVDRVIKTSEQGATTIDGDYHATNNTVPSSIGLIVHDRAGSPADIHQNFRPTGIQGSVNADVHAVDIALHDEAGNPYNESNPLPVFVAEGEGTEIWDYKTSAALAAAANATHTYSPTGVDLKVSKIYVSGSGKLKVEVQVNSVTKFVGFNSTANPNIEFDIKPALFVGDGLDIDLIITNRDNQAQDVYSTVVGYES